MQQLRYHFQVMVSNRRTMYKVFEVRSPRSWRFLMEIHMLVRLRHLLFLLLCLPAASLMAAEATVYKTPTCGCCTAWMDHLKTHGFEVNSVDLRDLTQVKQRHGVTRELASCHTAVIEGYVIEGHVPAEDIKRLLETRPDVAGLAVPGMPMGSPGMEGPVSQSYDVLSFDKAGATKVFSRH